MSRTGVLIVIGLTAICLGGCAPVGEVRDLEFQLRRAEDQRDTAQQRLAGEQARLAKLQGQIEAERRDSTEARATVTRLNARVRELTRNYDELAAVIDELRNRPLARPAVPPSPLPSEIDDALSAYAGQLPNRVWYERERAGLSFANDRLFETGSDVVRADAHAALHELAAILTPLADEYEITVVGHTDDVPITKPETKQQHPSNWHLSVHRAIAVQQVLIKAGLPAERLGVMGYAQYRPVGDDRARNRRVEIFIVRQGAIEPLHPVRRAPG